MKIPIPTNLVENVINTATKRIENGNRLYSCNALNEVLHEFFLSVKTSKQIVALTDSFIAEITTDYKKYLSTFYSDKLILIGLEQISRFDRANLLKGFNTTITTNGTRYYYETDEDKKHS